MLLCFFVRFDFIFIAYDISNKKKGNQIIIELRSKVKKIETINKTFYR